MKNQVVLLHKSQREKILELQNSKADFVVQLI